MVCVGLSKTFDLVYLAGAPFASPCLQTGTPAVRGGGERASFDSFRLAFWRGGKENGPLPHENDGVYVRSHEIIREEEG